MSVNTRRAFSKGAPLDARRIAPAVLGALVGFAGLVGCHEAAKAPDVINPYQLTIGGRVVLDLRSTGDAKCDGLKKDLVATTQKKTDDYLRECSNKPSMTRQDCLRVMDGMMWSYQAKKVIVDALASAKCSD